jgi:lysophospholipase
MLFITRHVPLISSLPLICSTPDTLFDYSIMHTQLFLDQTQANVIGGFVPKTSSADPNFGKCMQCAAIDRARYKVVPPLSRSSFCTQCFQQYCFNPNNLTSSSELPNRKYEFADPDPDELSTVWQFLSRNKVTIILGFICLFTAIAVLCVFLCVYSRKFLCVLY